MSIALAHFAIGSTLATVAVLYFVPHVPYQRVIILISGVWAMIPDITKLNPPYGDRLSLLFDSVWGNVFWFHQRIDTIDVTDSLLFAAIAIGAFISVTLIAERWEYTVEEHQRDPEAGSVDPGQSISFLRVLLSIGALLYSAVIFIGAVVIEEFTILYIGTGATLGISGLIGGSIVPADIKDRTPWQTLPAWIVTPVQLILTFSTLIIASGLLTSLRSLDALDAVYVGIALLLLILLAVLATYWS